VTELITCTRCGRRGVQAFIPADTLLDGATGFVCSNIDACNQRRNHTTTPQAATAPPTATAAGGAGREAGGTDLAAVGALVRELDALRRRMDAQVDELTRAIGVHGDQLADAALRLDTLTEQHAALAAVVKGLADQVKQVLRRGQRPPAFSYLTISTEPAFVRRRLTALVDWMQRVFLRYPDAATALPECWLWHPDVVEELSVLHQTWDAAYDPDTGTATLAGDWHDRYRPGVIRRLRATASSCSLRTHAPRTPDQQVPAATVAPFADAITPIAAWWATDRGQPAPAPTDDQLTAADQLARPRNGAHR